MIKLENETRLLETKTKASSYVFVAPSIPKLVMEKYKHEIMS